MAVQELYDLAHRIALTDPEDAGLRTKLLDELRGVRRELKERSGTDLGGLLDAGIVLVAFLFELDRAAGGEVLQLVSRLVCLTAQHVAQVEAAAAAGATPAAPLPAQALEVPVEEKPIDLSQASEIRLGEILIRLKHVTIRDVEMALIHQRQTGIKLGQALVEIGATDFEQIQEALRVQGKIREGGANVGLRLRSAEKCLGERPTDADLRLVSDTYLGEQLIRRGSIDQKQLEEAILVQRATGIRIGEALVEIGAIGWEDLEETIRRQRERSKTRPAVGPIQGLRLE